MNNEILFEQLVEEADKVENMTTIPDKDAFPRYGYDDVIDEDMSVKWNREEVMRRNEAYAQEKKRLFSEINDAEKSLDNMIKAYIAQEVPLSLDKASIIFSKLYEDHHSYGYDNILDHVDEEIHYIQSIVRED